MVDNSTGDYFASSLGSISGFNQVTPPTGNPSLTQTGWSIDSLQQFLLNISDINFPTEDWVRKVDELITSHIADFNNPHRVTLDQIIADFTRDVLGNIVPGTVPDAVPFFAYDAVCPLPLNDIYPASYTYSNLYSMNEGGVLLDSTQDSELLGTDSSSGKPGLPLFLPFSTVTPLDWATEGSTALNTTLTPSNLSSVFYPFPFYTVTETNQSNSSFGLNIPCTTIVGNVYTTTFFVRATNAGGSLLVYQNGDQNNTAEISLLDGSVTTVAPAMVTEAYLYPSGVIRISVCYTAANTSNAVVVNHINPNDTSSNRTGQVGRQIFLVAYPTTSHTSLNHPIVLDLTAPASSSPMVLSLDAARVPPTLPSLMITLTLDLYPTLSNNVITYDPVLSFGNLQIRRDQTSLYVYLGSNLLFTSTILEGLNIVSLSYSPTTIVFKDLATARQTVTGSFTGLSTSTVTFGRFNGYLRSFAFYAGSDTNQCLEFLTNG